MSRATFEYDGNNWGRRGRVGEGDRGSGRRRNEQRRCVFCALCLMPLASCAACKATTAQISFAPEGGPDRTLCKVQSFALHSL
jgi:hypothetical protein